MNTRKIILGAIITMFCATATAQTDALQRSTPEEQGLRSEPIAAFLDSMMHLPYSEMHSIMILRHGRVVAETYPKPFSPAFRHTLYSCSKTFTAAAVGLAVDDNRLRVTDRLATFFPELLPDSVSPQQAGITVRHLLTMASGIEPDWQLRSLTDNWTKAMLAKPAAEPGRQFKYDSMCTYLLSAIVQKATGKTLLQLLNERIFSHLGIDKAEWEVSPEGCDTGGWGLALRSEDLAKFGQLLLQRGQWKGRRLLSEQWVDDMMGMQMKNDALGYGYQMWLCERPKAARADGAYGQLIYVVPDADMVVVVTQCSTADFGRQRRLLWDTIDKALADTRLKPGRWSKRLAAQAAQYALPTAEGKAASKAMAQFDGRTLHLDENPIGWQKISFAHAKGRLTLTITNTDGETADIECANRQWAANTTTVHPYYSINPHGRFKGISTPFHVAASYGWGKHGELNIKLKYVDWITPIDLTINNGGGTATVSARKYNEHDTDTFSAHWE